MNPNEKRVEVVARDVCEPLLGRPLADRSPDMSLDVSAPAPKPVLRGPIVDHHGFPIEEW